MEVLAHAIAIVVMRDVLAPVHQRRPRLLGHLAVVVGIDFLVAAVGLDDGCDEHDGIVANLLNEWGIFDDQAVREFHQHLRAAGFGRMDAARDPVDRLAGVDDLLGLLFGGLARVGECGQVGLVFVEVLDRLFVADGEDDHVAAFFGLHAELPELCARRILGEFLVVAVDVCGVVELAGLAGHVAEKLQRCGHLRRGGQVIDQFRREPRVGQILLDLLRVFLVVRLLWCIRLSDTCM